MRRRIFLTVAALALVLTATLGSLQVQAQSGVVRVEAESYVDFWDSTPGNAGGVCRTDDVDVRQQDGSCTVGWVASGEWLEYQVTLPSSGSYVIFVRSASAVAGNQLTVAVAGQSATVNVVNTGSAGSFAGYNGPSLSLPGGSHRLRITFSASAMDLNYIELRLTSAVPTTAVPTTAVPTTAVPTTPPVVTPVPGGEPPLLPGPSAPQNLGPFFQLKCDTLFANNDDPIVYPGQNNAAHEHLFFGNTSTNENSTYASLLAAGTSCQEAPADTAAYWIPTLYRANGTEARPYRVRAYYYSSTLGDKSRLKSIPPDLRIIAGDMHATGPQPKGVIEFLCRDRQNQGPGLPLSVANPPTCTSSQYLSVSIRFPDCLAVRNGQPVLDSSDHRRHAAYSDEDTLCPSTHPYKIPKLRLSIVYEDDGGYSGGQFTLGGPAGGHHALAWYQLHADFWNAWQQPELDRLVDGCLRRRQHTGGLSCNP